MSDKLVNALRDYQQADTDGIMVLVSRQACDHAADEIERLQEAVELLKEANLFIDDDTRIVTEKIETFLEKINT